MSIFPCCDRFSQVVLKPFEDLPRWLMITLFVASILFIISGIGACVGEVWSLPIPFSGSIKGATLVGIGTILELFFIAALAKRGRGDLTSIPVKKFTFENKMAQHKLTKPQPPVWDDTLKRITTT